MEFQDIKKGMKLTNGKEVIEVLGEPRYSIVFKCDCVETTNFNNGCSNYILADEVKSQQAADCYYWEIV